MTPGVWQPIDTAPKDGARIFLFAPTRAFADAMTVGWFSASGKEWLSEPGLWQRLPTHWMPLPVPPSPSLPLPASDKRFGRRGMRGRGKLGLVEMIRIQAWWYGREVRDWFARWIYAQHNARVIIDFERRMTTVICEASGNMMSKPYYDADVMLSMIRGHINQTWEDGYAEGRKDLAEELEVEDPNPPLGTAK